MIVQMALKHHPDKNQNTPEATERVSAKRTVVLYRTKSSAYAEIARHANEPLDACRQSSELHIFHTALVFLSRIRYYDPGLLQYAGIAETPTYPVLCRFSLLVISAK